MKEIIEPKELEIDDRIKNFNEVVIGYKENEALKEANRCIQCKNPTCIIGCPVEINIKKFIYHITKKEYDLAYYTITEKNMFPSICGRVCPAEYQCRKSCVLTPRNSNYASKNSINIGLLERFIGDYAQNNINYNLTTKKNNKYKIACIGSGPASLTVASELIKYGIRVDIFEALHCLGGVLSYGIPNFRLPRNILYYEINILKKLGVNFYTGIVVGQTLSFLEILKNYDYVFIGIGAGVPMWLNIKGENLVNIYSANEYLTRANLMHSYEFPKFNTPINVGEKILVIGAGNTAIDSARVALRLQKINNIEGKVTIIYRRTEEEMPARKVEIDHAKQEGVEFKFLLQPKEFIGDSEGKVKFLKCLKCELKGVDETGRKKPVVIPNSDILIETDLVIIAIGLKPNKILTTKVKNLILNEFGEIEVNKETMQTSLEKVYAGGDIVQGEGTVIEAMRMGKKAALSILKKLKIS